MRELLPADLAAEVERAAETWRRERGTRRLWARDATLWTGGDEGRWLGWLDGPARESARIPEYLDFRGEALGAGFTDALVLGMGGSSLFPEVLARTFDDRPNALRLHVLDTTDPAAVLAMAERLEPARTLVVVASKSGATIEPNALLAFFLERFRASLGDDAGAHFVAITDPGSTMLARATAARFRRVFLGEPSIGGRYSALSPFGMVPAALAGIDLERFLERARAMADACRDEETTNPGVRLGLVLGVAARSGRDKATLFPPPQLPRFGAWLEQLLAESTGKNGKAILPIAYEPAAEPGAYGADRLFVATSLAGVGHPDAHALEALADAGAAVVESSLGAPEDLAGEVFRWELATAVAGSILKIHPFDQPDVESAKVAARKVAAEVEAKGSLPPETALATDGGCAFFADSAFAPPPGANAEAILSAHLARLGARDYFAVLAFLSPDETVEAPLERLRTRVRDAKRVATTFGFGPRYLHSTGQAHKGGPASGVFLMITADVARDAAIPGDRITFGQLEAAQARGDFAVLTGRGRRILRVHLKLGGERDLESALIRLDETVAAALAATGPRASFRR